MAEAPQGEPVAALREVTLAGSGDRGALLCRVSLEVGAGALALVYRARHAETRPLFDLLAGLRAPDEGRAEFLGRDWSTLSAFDQSRLRGRIGWVWDGQAWISNLDLYENLVLAQRHHTTRSEEDLRREATDLMKAAGFEAIPSGRTHLLRRHELRWAQWARAFLGAPALALLEHPEADTPRESWPRLIELVQRARAGGTAVVWATENEAAWPPALLRATGRFRWEDDRLRAVEDTG